MGTEQGSILIDGDIPVALRRSARARRMTLRVARAGGQVVLTLPVSVSVAEGRAFAESRAGWLRKIRATAPQPSVVSAGALMPIEGRMLRLTPTATRLVGIEGEHLIYPANRPAGPTVSAWLKQMARSRLALACDRYARQIGRPYRAITLRDTRSRWGSCTHDGRLMFSWRLAMAPPEVLDYVAAHEVAHLKHMDHSPAFWAATASLMPGYERQRQWLRVQGHELLAWSFEER